MSDAFIRDCRKTPCYADCTQTLSHSHAHKSNINLTVPVCALIYFNIQSSSSSSTKSPSSFFHQEVLTTFSIREADNQVLES